MTATIGMITAIAIVAPLLRPFDWPLEPDALRADRVEVEADEVEL